MRRKVRARPILFTVVLVAASLAAGPLGPRGAMAMLSSCRSDPQVILSNGAVIDLQASIGDSTSDVQNITYTLHAPTGTHVLTFTNTDSLLGLIESFHFYADDPVNTYDTYTVVSTRLSSIPVTAITTVVSPLGLTLSSKSASGWNKQNLHVTTLALL